MKTQLVPPALGRGFERAFARAALAWLLLAGVFTPPALRADPPYLPVTYDGNGFFHLNSGQSAYVGYKPDTYTDAQPISLLVWTHGCGGDSEGDMYAIAPIPTRRTQSYIAISIGGRDGDCWDVNADTAKVLAAVADITRYFNINPRKIYLAGYSSGGDLTYRVGFQNTTLFAGFLVENSDPFRDTGASQASLLASATWKVNIAHLAHLSDSTYPIALVRTDLATLSANGFPVTKIEKAGKHYDPDNGAFGTTYDLIHFLLPFVDVGWVSPPRLVNPAVARNASSATITFPSVYGKTYTVQFSSALGAVTTWTTLQTNIPGTGANIPVADPGVGGAPKRFYRVLGSP